MLIKNPTDDILWNDLLETRLRELYARKDVVDIYWGRHFEEKKWSVYAITRNTHNRRSKMEAITNGPDIHIIAEESAFSIFDPPHVLETIPPSLREEFDKALDNELGQDFRKAHYNLVGMSTGYKWQSRKQTATPAILLYVRQKGILRRGCAGFFPKEIRGFPTDVIEAMPAMTCRNREGENCRRFDSSVSLGVSVGSGRIHQATSGSLGVIAKSQGQLGFISCEHVLKYEESGFEQNIYQPSWSDSRDTLDRLRKDYRFWTIYDMEYQKLAHDNIANLLEDDNKRQRRIAHCTMHREIAKNHLIRLIDSIKCERQNDTNLASYVIGIRDNILSNEDQKRYGVDAAFARFNTDNRSVWPTQFPITPEGFIDAGLQNDMRVKGYYSLEDLKAFKRSTKVFKVGRTTGLTAGEWVEKDDAIATEIPRKSLKYALEKHGTTGVDFEELLAREQGDFINYMKTTVEGGIADSRQICFPIRWFERQIIIRFEARDFDEGDSGASVIDENGMILGILHACWEQSKGYYAIASPIFAVQEALGVELCLEDRMISLFR